MRLSLWPDAGELDARVAQRLGEPPSGAVARPSGLSPAPDRQRGGRQGPIIGGWGMHLCWYRYWCWYHLDPFGHLVI